MKIELKMTATVEVEFDEKSPAFIEMYESYKKYFSNVDYEGFAEQIVSHVCRYGGRDQIEGVGNVAINGEKQTYWKDNQRFELDHPINVIYDADLNDRVNFESEYTLTNSNAV